MTKIIEFKRPLVWESAQEMAEAFAQRLGENEDGLADNLYSAVIIYRLKDGGIAFECNEGANALDVGMMSSAVHIACLYEIGSVESGEEVLH
tara:strand:- start:96 stop:371 length:276 start_codon:yes stop_codon:yes gene_type:complete